MLKLGAVVSCLALLAFARAPAFGEEKVVTMRAIDAEGLGAEIGTLTLTDAPSGLRIMPDLSGLSPGVHGMHVHEKPDCGPAKQDGVPTAGLKAGGHLDPGKTGAHKGPFRDGHLGDLPYLTFDAAGQAKIGVVAPRLKIADVVGHAIIIHEGADNYADEPQPLGGGGARVACGVVE
jgi:Cu-Zn family superoxide dismutase